MTFCQNELSESNVVLGNRLDDPYNITFMEQAFNIMRSNGYVFPFSQLSPTGKYVKVFVRNAQTERILLSDTSIIWSDIPLDYEIIQDGAYYHDPDLPDTSSWLYAVLPINYTFQTGIRYYLQYYVFIPQDHPLYRSHEELFDTLEELSLTLFGNETVENSPEDRTTKWAPKATIYVKDDILNNYFPLQGAIVTARHYTKLRSKTTNADGHCEFNNEFKTGHRVKYGITWRAANGLWVIKENSNRVHFSGPKREGPWTQYITIGRKAGLYV